MSDRWKHFEKAFKHMDRAFEAADQAFDAADEPVASAKIQNMSEHVITFNAKNWTERRKWSIKFMRMMVGMLFGGKASITLVKRTK